MTVKLTAEEQVSNQEIETNNLEQNNGIWRSRCC
jgi:hypothetical protein